MIICSRCGHENPDGQHLCSTCRAYLGWARNDERVVGRAAEPGSAESAPQPPAPQPPAREAPAPEAPAPEAPAPRPAADPRATAAPVTARAAPVAPRKVVPGSPQRTIPTVIADTPLRHPPTAPPVKQTVGPSGRRQFDAVRPDDLPGSGTVGASPTRPRRDAPPDSDTLDRVVRCPACRYANPAGRRFCRCGATLASDPPPEDDDDLPDVRVPWRRRIRDGFGPSSSFWQAMRHANDGARAKFDAAQSLRNRTAQLAAGLGIAGLVGSQVGPWGADLRATAWERASAYLPFTYTVVAASGATTEPASEPLPGFGPENAVDLDTGRAWVTAWRPTEAVGEPCMRPAGADRLVVSFDPPVDVDRVSVAGGLPASSQDRARQNRPKVVDVELSDGTCVELRMRDEPQPQPVRISGSGIESVTVSVVEVEPGEPDTEPGRLVGLSEVVVEQR